MNINSLKIGRPIFNEHYYFIIKVKKGREGKALLIFNPLPPKKPKPSTRGFSTMEIPNLRSVFQTEVPKLPHPLLAPNKNADPSPYPFSPPGGPLQAPKGLVIIK